MMMIEQVNYSSTPEQPRGRDSENTGEQAQYTNKKRQRWTKSVLPVVKCNQISHSQKRKY